MTLEVTDDAAAIIALVEPLLAADPVRNTVLGSVIEALRNDGAAGWCAHPAGAADILAVRSDRPYPVVVAGPWESVDLAELAPLVSALPAVAGLTGLAAVVDALAAAVAALGVYAERGRQGIRLFRLDHLTEPSGVIGGPRRATVADLALLLDWYRAFAKEVDHGEGGVERAVDAALASDSPWLWLDDGGAPVSLANRRAPAAGSSRIGPVYTPPAERGRGYGSAVTAAATRDSLDDGATPVLFTDRANPTSNKIYARLGYYPVEDRLAVRFS